MSKIRRKMSQMKSVADPVVGSLAPSQSHNQPSDVANFSDGSDGCGGGGGSKELVGDNPAVTEKDSGGGGSKDDADVRHQANLSCSSLL